MFYSHQLLARKAPLGQIWMAATMHAKINRKKLDKLNIIKICEEILNPSVPMALRLSGILMGGVVIVYERKVKLLYDDVTRLLVEINEAWKVKAAPDPTVLPKRKSQAKKEAVTLPVNEAIDFGDIEQSLNFSNATKDMEFQQTAYFAMRLDNMDEPYINNNSREEDQFQNFHQADAENITLLECFDSYQVNADLYDRFERFDIEGNEDTQMNFTSGEHTQILTIIPSPPPQDNPQRADETQNLYPEPRVNQQSEECKEGRQDQQRQGPRKRKTRSLAASIMDYEQTIIPGHVYQSWLQNATDIVSKKGRKRKSRTGTMSTMKISNLMDLPSIVLIDDLFNKGNKEIYYPAPLLDLWVKSIQPPHDSPSERTSPPLPPAPSSVLPPEGARYNNSTGFPYEDFPSGVGSQPFGFSWEKLRTMVNNDVPAEIFMEEMQASILNNGMGTAKVNHVTPENSRDEMRSIPSAASGHVDPSLIAEVSLGRSNKKMHHSSSRHSRQSSSFLEPVMEENSWQHLKEADLNFELSMLSENGLTPNQELLVETGPTQTQQPVINPPVDKITDSIKMQMKMHFDTPGAPQVESLNNLAAGMNRKGAALLFYQTCVLASRDFLRVEQKLPYGDILISRGAKM